MISLIIIVVIKQYKPEFSIYISIISGTVIIYLILPKVVNVITLINSVANRASINRAFIDLLIKITAIAFLTEFASSICKDSGESSIANKIEIGGKFIIITMSIPIISALMETIAKVLP